MLSAGKGRRGKMNRRGLIVMFVLILLVPQQAQAPREEGVTGILVMAHGTRHHGKQITTGWTPMAGYCPAAVGKDGPSVVRDAAIALEMPRRTRFRHMGLVIIPG
jgi:hypothetical protein